MPLIVHDEPPPTTPGRPPSPRLFSDPKDDMDVFPAPPPPRESLSVPASFPRSQHSRLSKLDVSSLPTSALPSRTGSPTWRRPTSGWSKMTEQRGQLPKLYQGKDQPSMNLTALGQWGPGMYEVKRPPIVGTPRFGSGERFDRQKADSDSQFVTSEKEVHWSH